LDKRKLFMRNIFIIHGRYGYPEENWFPWLKKELSKLGHKVFVPQFPVPKNSTPGGHKPEKWLKEFSQYKKYINEETIIVAHSRGCVFSYLFLETLKKPVDSIYLVAPWIYWKTCWYPKGYEKFIDPFHKKPLDWNKIKKNAKHFEIFQSTNDDTPVSEGKKIAKRLGAELNIVKNAGHFNVAYDKKFVKFSSLLKTITDHIGK